MTRKNAFTLVEILIVVIILGILAAVVVPQFSSASNDARESMLKDGLRSIRVQIQVFRAHHCEVAPGYPGCNPANAADEATFIAHMTQASDADGNTAAPGTVGFDFGPYLREMTTNPLNELATVQIVGPGAIPAGDNSHGWMYQPSTMIFVADTPGMDENGKQYTNY